MRTEDYKRRIHEIACLEENWDSYNAPKIDYAARMLALEIVKHVVTDNLIISPTSEGGVELLFDQVGDDGNIEVFMNIAPGGKISIDAL